MPELYSINPNVIRRRSTFLEDWADMLVAETRDEGSAVGWEAASPLASAASAYLEAVEGLLFIGSGDALRVAKHLACRSGR